MLGETNNRRITMKKGDICEEVKKILKSAETSLKKVQSIESGTDLLFLSKFTHLGTRWNNNTPGDLSEQIQQSMTMLLSYYAINWFCDNLSLDNTDFVINAADKKGPDISFEYAYQNQH